MRKSALILGSLIALCGALFVAEVAGRHYGYRDARVLNFNPAVGPFVPVTRAGSGDPKSCHIVIVGDSVVDGIRDRIGEIANASVAGNDGGSCIISVVALGWWAPENQRRYFDTFGWPNATQMLLVLNSDDLDSDWLKRRTWSDQFNYPQSSGIIGFLKTKFLAKVENRLYPSSRESGVGVPELNQLIKGASLNEPEVILAWHPRLEDTISNRSVPEEFQAVSARYDADLITLKYEESDYADRIHPPSVRVVVRCSTFL